MFALRRYAREFVRVQREAGFSLVLPKVQTIAACGVRLSKRFPDDSVFLLRLGVEVFDLLSDESNSTAECICHSHSNPTFS
jgi:hypothetical protein